MQKLHPIKKAVHSFFYYKPDKETLFCFALSALKLKEHFEQVELVTDEPGAELLLNRLKLPYTKVNIQKAQKNWALSKINAYEPRVAQMSSLAEFMRPMPNSKSSVVNETMNAVMKSLSCLDAEISREMFQDRIKFSSFKKVLIKTARIHPQVFKLMIEHLGIKGSFWWISNPPIQNCPT